MFEVAFEGLNRPSRQLNRACDAISHLATLRWDKPAAEADRIETLEKLLAPGDKFAAQAPCRALSACPPRVNIAATKS